MKTFTLNTYIKNSSAMPLWITSTRDRRTSEALHRHDCMEIMYIRGGSGGCRINDRHFPAVRGDMYVMMPDDVHEFTVSSSLAFDTVLFDLKLFTGQELAELSQFACFRSWCAPGGTATKKLRIPLKTAVEVESILSKMLQECLRRTEIPGAELLLKADLIRFLVLAMRHCAQGECSENGKNDMQLSRLLDYISRHYQENISVETLAKVINVSPNYLGELVYKNLNITLSNYIANYRVEQARLLLESSSDSIAEIALAVGFYDSSHFIRIFRKCTGVTPGEYRKLLK